MTEILEILPTVPAAMSATLPASATYRLHLPARTNNRRGILPVALFHFAVYGEESFIMADGDTYPHLPCHRCGGFGEYSWNEMDGSICYGCNGDGLGRAITWADAERIAKQRIAKRRREERARMLAIEEQAHAWNAWRGDHADVIAWLAGKDDKPGFVGDMARKTAVLETLSPRMVAAVRKIAGERAAEAAVKAAAGHFGTIGTRVEITATVKSSRFFDNDFGGSWLIIMETAEGHELKTFTSGAFVDAAKEGETITFKATPKAHEEYKGAPSTMLSRCAVAKAKK